MSSVVQHQPSSLQLTGCFFKLICDLYQSIFCFVNFLLFQRQPQFGHNFHVLSFHPSIDICYMLSQENEVSCQLCNLVWLYFCVFTHTDPGIHLYLFSNYLIYLLPSFKSALVSNLLKDVSVLQHILSSDFSSCIKSCVQQYPSRIFSISVLVLLSFRVKLCLSNT